MKNRKEIIKKHFRDLSTPEKRIILEEMYRTIPHFKKFVDKNFPDFVKNVVKAS